MAETQSAPQKGGGTSAILTVVIATVIALAAGASFEFFGRTSEPDGAQPVAAKTKPAASKGDATKSDEAVDGKPGESSEREGELTDYLLDLPAIKTSLMRDKSVWVRIEMAIVFPEGPLENESEITAQLVEDMTTFSRTLTLEQLSSASGLEYLRDDLIDRVRMRTGGAGQNVIIKSLLLE